MELRLPCGIKCLQKITALPHWQRMRLAASSVVLAQSEDDHTSLQAHCGSETFTCSAARYLNNVLHLYVTYDPICNGLSLQS